MRQHPDRSSPNGARASLSLTATMGNDGGSIPDRRDLVRTKAKVRGCLQPIFPFANPGFRRLRKPIRRTRLVPGGSFAHSPKSAHPLRNTVTLVLIFPKRLLQEPIVSCALGKLYNKDAILEYLLDKSSYGDGEVICGHIRSLKVSRCASSSSYTASFTPKFPRG